LENELGPAPHLDKSAFAPAQKFTGKVARGVIGIGMQNQGRIDNTLRIQKAVAVTAHDVTLLDQTNKIISLGSAVHFRAD
jgi:hypothetical protein